MTNLSQEQEEMRQSIQKRAMIWSIIIGIIAAGILFWALGSQSTMVRFGAAAVGGIIVLLGVFKWRFNANSKSAQCENCSAAFSISKTNHVETLKSGESKENRDKQEDRSTNVTTWTEEVYDVVDTYTCANCSDEKTKEYITTRKKDEKTEVEPAPVEEKAATTRKRPPAKPSVKKPAAKTSVKKPAAKKTASTAKSKKPSDVDSSKKE